MGCRKGKNKQTTKQKNKKTNKQPISKESFERPLESQEKGSPETRCGSTFLHSTAQ